MPSKLSGRILLADDHSLFLNGLRALLERQPGLEVVGEAMDGRNAVTAALEKLPDVVIMDVSMPIMNGIEATRRITSELPAVKVLCLSMHAEARFVEGALEAGAAGYVLKECALEELLTAIRAVTGGQTYLSPAIAGTVVEALKTQRTRSHPSVFALLSEREREVLQLLAEGDSAKEIAARLNLSVKTVGTYRERMMTKLDIHSLAGLVKYAIQEGLTSSRP